MKTNHEILRDGPRSTRWIGRAQWLYLVAERRGVKEQIDAAFVALQHFVEAREHRRTYEALIVKKASLHTDAAREHRKGVKAYEAARKLIFP